MLHKAGTKTDEGDEEGKEKKAPARKVISRTVSSLTTSMAPLKMGTFDQNSSKKGGDSEEETDKFQAQMAERRQKYLREKRTPQLSRKHSLFMEEGSDLDSDEDDVDSHSKVHHPFSLASGGGSASASLHSLSLHGQSSAGGDTDHVKGVRDIANMTPEEIQVLLDELADDSSLVSVSSQQHPHSKQNSFFSKKDKHHQKSTSTHATGRACAHTPVRKQRFKDLIWGRAAQHMQATSQQVDPLMKIMREEASLMGAEMMEDQFGERYTRKDKWEAVEHARHLERQRIRREKALEKATALL